MQRIQNLQNQLLSQNDKEICILQLNEKEEYGIIKLNKTKGLNNLDSELMQEISQNLKKLQQNVKIKCVGIISTSEKAFCAGADIKEINKTKYEEVLIKDQMEEFRQSLSNFSKPLIIAANGYILGGGFELALSGDIIICTKDSKFGLPEINLGVVPGIGGTQRLTRIIGRQLASYYIMTGQQLDAETALKLNIVTKVVDSFSILEKEMKEVLKQVANKSRTALIIAKQCIQASQDLGLAQGIIVEKQLFHSTYNTQAKQIGTQAFIDKKKPDFKNV